MKQRIRELREEVEKGRKMAKEEGRRAAYWTKRLKLEIVEVWKSSGMSQTEFAKRVGVAPGSLGAWAQGKSLEPHTYWKKMETESNEIGKLIPPTKKVKDSKKKEQVAEAQPAFLTFEVSDSCNKGGEEPNLDSHFEYLKQGQNAPLGSSHPGDPIGVLFPSGVKVSIPSEHPEILSMLRVFMEGKEGGCDV